MAAAGRHSSKATRIKWKERLTEAPNEYVDKCHKSVQFKRIKWIPLQERRHPDFQEFTCIFNILC